MAQDYDRYVSELKAKSPAVEYARVAESGRELPLLRIETQGSRLLLITAGFHGEEPAGPLTLLAHYEAIAAYARERDVALRIYPCINPSGFISGRRYNDSGEKPNNDFLRYEVAPGDWRGELHGETPLGWKLFDGGPKETRAVRSDLALAPTPIGALDLHQDNWMKEQATYTYVFGDDADYVPLVHASSHHAKVAVRCAVDEHNRTDDHGLIRYHDGSITDWFYRRGSRFCAALETTTATPMDACQQVNLIWIRGFIDLISSPGTKTTS